ncbi:MAG: YidB family protein [Thermodesulfobacteriota bacterium]
MGFLDEIIGQAAGALLKSGGEQSGMLQGVLDVMNQPEVGGMQGLLDKFTQSGLGDQVNSWVGTGDNLPISSDQIQQALGGYVEQIAAKAGVNPSLAGTVLSQVLPALIDKITPQGRVPEHMSQLGGLEKLLDMFK